MGSEAGAFVPTPVPVLEGSASIGRSAAAAWERHPRAPAGTPATPQAGSVKPDALGMPPGKVYLVGAGPGDPELLTLRALRVLRRADVVLYDHLVSTDVLGLVRRGTQRIYVGKERSNHTLPQPEINRLMVVLARRGRQVVRLKGGDPFMFGRGGEEIETLSAEGVAFEIVPGVTAANGVAAYAGIPLTHRDCAHACVFVTGHLKDGTMNLDWEALARPRQTVVVYMGLLGLPVLCYELIRHGLARATPAAIIERGTTPEQRIVTGTLASLPAAAHAARMRPPTLIIIGEVVRLREKLAWFERRAAAATPAAMAGA